MPIVKTDSGYTRIEYTIPKEIKNRIPDYFYYAMAGELVSVFGPYILEEQDYLEYDDEGNVIEPLSDTPCTYYNLNSSTGGWIEAFKETCRKLDMMWLVDYWRTLEWYDSDLFDGEIEDEIVERFCKKDHFQESGNCYYMYLCDKL